MTRPQALPLDTLRFFARIDRFTCECPRCGQLIIAHFDRKVGEIRKQQAQRKRPARGLHLTYNPLTSRLTCPSCTRVFAVGLLLYPVSAHHPGAMPVDSRPSWQQLLTLRQEAGGYFLPGRKHRGAEPVNQAVELPCICRRHPKLRAGCPIHGYDEKLRIRCVRAIEEGRAILARKVTQQAQAEHARAMKRQYELADQAFAVSTDEVAYRGKNETD